MRWLALVVLLAACPKSGDKPKPVEQAKRDDAHVPVRAVEDATATAAVTALPPAPPLPAVPAGLPAPPANPRITPEAVAFGELLFHDGRLAASGARSCVNCHDPATGYAGPVQRAADDKPNLRRTPTLVNLAWSRAFGWDGRYPSFAAHLPAHLKGQLGDSLETVTARIAEVPLYKLHLARIGGAPQDAIVQALEAYTLTRYEGDSAWDRIERTALTKPGSAPADPVVAGYQLFMGKAQCGTCHVPPLYTDHGFHRVTTNPFRDPGNKDARGGFKTPTLRGAAARPAFFHSGSPTMLDDAVLQYATPPADADPIVAKIKLTTDEAKQLVTFLNALTSDHPTPTKPVLP